MVFAGLVKRYDALVKSRGQTIKVPNISNLSVTAKTANADVTTQTVTETATTISIDKWYESSFEIEDIVAVQSSYDLNKLGSFYGNVDIKNREFGENPERITPSGVLRNQETCNDYVRISCLIGERDSLNSMGTLRA